MSCKHCSDIGPLEDIEYSLPDEWDPEGSFRLCTGDSYYDIGGISYCPWCGSKLTPPAKS